MSKLPRRTNELTEAKQERLSRIAQPINRLSRERSRSLRRTSSEQHLGNGSVGGNNNQLLNPYLTSSTFKKKKRSVSATPLRTPNRQNGRPIETPLHITSEKKHYADDKRLINEKAAKISEYVEKHIFTGKEGLSSQNGLKMMSTKEFVAIINYFLKFIFGNRLQIRSNYVEEVPKLLLQIGYPYTVNKSWLKTPTAPHAYSYIVTLLDWLLTFAPPTVNSNENDDEKDFDYKYIVCNNEFPDEEFTWKFLQKEKKGFALWNNMKEDEFENFKKCVTDDLILRKTGLNGISVLNKEIEEINEQIEEIKRNRCVIQHEETFFQKDKEVNNKKKILNELQNENTKYKKQSKTIEVNNDKCLIEINSVKKRIKDYEEIVKKQKLSVQQRDELNERIDYLTQKLDAHKKTVSQLQNLGHNNQIIYARELKKFRENITEFNSLINKLFCGQENLGELNIQNLILDQSIDDKKDEKIEKISSILKDFKENLSQANHHYENQLRNLEKELKILNYEYNENIICKYEYLKKKYDKLETQIQDVDNKIIEINIREKKKIELIEFENKDLLDENIKLNGIIKQKQIEFEEYEKENLEILNNYIEKFNKILNKKEKYVKLFAESVRNFAKTMETIKPLIKK